MLIRRMQLSQYCILKCIERKLLSVMINYIKFIIANFMLTKIYDISHEYTKEICKIRRVSAILELDDNQYDFTDDLIYYNNLVLYYLSNLKYLDKKKDKYKKWLDYNMGWVVC